MTEQDTERLAQIREHAEAHSEWAKEMRFVFGTLDAKIARLTKEIDDLQQTFDLMWDADQRAIKRWQEAAPPGEDRSLTWPDRSKLTEWLLERIK